MCTNTHRTLPLWAAGRLALAPEKAGRYFARLLSSQKRHTNTSRRVAAKRHGTLRQWLSVSCGTRSAPPHLPLPALPCSVSLLRTAGDNIIHQVIVQTDPLCCLIQCHSCSLIGKILDAKLSFLFFLFAVTMQIFPKSELYNSAAAGQRIL